MSAEDNLREAIIAELRRQAANKEGELRVEAVDDSHVTIEGRVNTDDLVMVILGSLAGGP
ncbi:MAG TPA: hypothetical protein VHG92_08205 [Afifellaceae bacterium]|nr:hypothetical protein [Afifellaceae bacterium]